MKLKLKHLIFSLLILTAFGLILNGCHVDRTLNPLKYGRIYMPQAVEYPHKISLSIINKPQSIVFGAIYGGPDRPNVNIPVSFEVNPSLVDSFNTENLTSYSILPKDSYELSKTKAVIPAGENKTSALKLKIKTEGYIRAGGKKYLLPITMHVNGGKIKVNKKLQTTYFLIKGKYVPISKHYWTVIGVDHQANQKFPPSNVIDGNKKTRWKSTVNGGGPPPNPTTPHYISFDMGKSHNIHGFEILATAHNTGVRPKKVTFKFSDNGNNWKNGQTFVLPFPDQNKAKVYLSNPVKARYFKFIIEKNTKYRVSSVNEITAFKVRRFYFM